MNQPVSHAEFWDWCPIFYEVEDDLGITIDIEGWMCP